MTGRTIVGAVVGLLLLGCGEQPAEVKVEAEVIEVACGRCIYEMPGAEGCPWATHVDGEYYLVMGPVPQDHHSHGEDGICVMARQARVQGEVNGEYFVASEFELIPAENVPESGATEHDHVH